jgi:hypothetical protein
MLPFLRRVNDEPRFGNEPTFSMPLAIEDLAAALDSRITKILKRKCGK